MTLDLASELAELLSRLTEAQRELLGLLDRKRSCLTQRDSAGLAELIPAEQRLCTELQACHDRRQELLALASAEGLRADSIRVLADTLPQGKSQEVKQSIDTARTQSHLLRHQAMAQWVAMQRTMLHLSHMVEIIATGGHLKPTYGKGAAAIPGGSLMDQAV